MCRSTHNPMGMGGVKVNFQNMFSARNSIKFSDLHKSHISQPSTPIVWGWGQVPKNNFLAVE